MSRTPPTPAQDTTAEPRLYMALELSNKTWKVASSDGSGKPRYKNLEAGNTAGLRAEIAKAKGRFGIAEDAAVFSCYEAGRDGFWIHRYLEGIGVENIVVDPASIEVNRQARRAKTDKIDVDGLLARLIRYHRGDPKVWSVVRIPSVADEDARRLHREYEALKRERTRLVNRVRSQLWIHGIRGGSVASTLARLDELRCWDGQPLPSLMKDELGRIRERLGVLNPQIKNLRKSLAERLRSPQTESERKAAFLAQLKGVGPVGARVLATEFFGWRTFNNRRQVGSAAGLTATPYSSGDSERDQGISKAGNPRVRTMMIELAWGWLRYQPDSALAEWFQKRFGKGGGRMRRIGIVALARRLLVALWHFVSHGVVPADARLRVGL